MFSSLWHLPQEEATFLPSAEHCAHNFRIGGVEEALYASPPGTNFHPSSLNPILQFPSTTPLSMVLGCPSVLEMERLGLSAPQDLWSGPVNLLCILWVHAACLPPLTAPLLSISVGSGLWGMRAVPSSDLWRMMSYSPNMVAASSLLSPGCAEASEMLGVVASGMDTAGIWDCGTLPPSTVLTGTFFPLCTNDWCDSRDLLICFYCTFSILVCLWKL